MQLSASVQCVVDHYSLSKISREIPIVLHLHPRTRTALDREKIFEQISQNIQFTDPIGYLDMMMLEKNAKLIVTDSGGIQKEAFFYRVPCITLRDETDWVGLVDLGWNRRAPPGNSAN